MSAFQIKCFDKYGAWTGWIESAISPDAAVAMFSANSKGLMKNPEMHPARVELWEKPQGGEGSILKMVWDSRGVMEAADRFNAPTEIF